jgi:nucleoporin NUP82
VLKIPGAGEIQQLVISPNGVFLAILTSHTVHLAVLPDSSRLSEPDCGPMRVKTYTLGPTIHILSQSPVVSALWHPLGVAGMCLVTVTADSIVRIWELNVDNRWSFDSPTLTIDLINLANGTFSEEDLGTSIAGKNRGFSLDTVEMEVASACFGGTAAEEEDGWASMTLWVAMKEGDVYALCPVLPNRWQAPSTLIPSLSVSIVAKVAAVQDDKDISEEDKQNYMRQFNWISAIDSQEPAYLPSGSDMIPDVEVYGRPTVVRSVPELQGPFDLDPSPYEADNNHSGQLTDIYVAARRIDDELCFGEDESIFSGVGKDGLSIGIVCLSTGDGRVHVCLDPQGVEGRWASKSVRSSFNLPGLARNL